MKISSSGRSRLHTGTLRTQNKVKKMVLGEMEGGSKRVRCPDWSAEETKVLVDCVKAAFLEGGRPFLETHDWGEIKIKLSRKLADNCQARSVEQCRRRWDTLVKTYKHIDNYCVQTGQDHWQLDEDEIKSMHLATAYREDWYNMVKDVCTRCKRKRRGPQMLTPLIHGSHPSVFPPTPGNLSELATTKSDLLPKDLFSQPLVTAHQEVSSIIVTENSRSIENLEDSSGLPIHKRSKVDDDSHASPDLDFSLGTDAQRTATSPSLILDLLAPVPSPGNLAVETLSTHHQGLPLVTCQLPPWPSVEAERKRSELQEENEKQKKEIEMLKSTIERIKMERLQRQNQITEENLQGTIKRSNLGHPIKAVDIQSGGESHSFERPSYSKIFSNSFSELCKLPQSSTNFSLQVSTSSITRLWPDMEDVPGGSCTSLPKPHECSAEQLTNSTTCQTISISGYLDETACSKGGVLVTNLECIQSAKGVHHQLMLDSHKYVAEDTIKPDE